MKNAFVSNISNMNISMTILRQYTSNVDVLSFKCILRALCLRILIQVLVFVLCNVENPSSEDYKFLFFRHTIQTRT